MVASISNLVEATTYNSAARRWVVCRHKPDATAMPTIRVIPQNSLANLVALLVAAISAISHTRRAPSWSPKVRWPRGGVQVRARVLDGNSHRSRALNLAQQPAKP